MAGRLSLRQGRDRHARSLPSGDMPAADMFATRDLDESAKVMAALDALNGRFGRDTCGRGDCSPSRRPGRCEGAISRLDTRPGLRT